MGISIPSNQSNEQEEGVALLDHQDSNTPLDIKIDMPSGTQYPPSPQHSTEQAPEMEPKQCRICGMEEGEDNDDDEEEQGSYMERDTERDWLSQTNPLIRPCLCKGSMMYVHVNCLNRWRESSPRPESYVACDLCGYRYNIHRPRYAAFVSNRWFLRSITTLSVLALVVVMAYLCKVVDVFVLRRSIEDEWHGPTIAWMDVIYLVAGVVAVSLLGIVYLVYTCTVSGQHSAGVPLVCDQTGCPWYGCYFADFTACSGDAALGGLVVFAAFMALLTVAFGIVGAASGAYALMKTLVEHVAGRVKERILEVSSIGERH